MSRNRGRGGSQFLVPAAVRAPSVSSRTIRPSEARELAEAAVKPDVPSEQADKLKAELDDLIDEIDGSRGKRGRVRPLVRPEGRPVVARQGFTPAPTTPSRPPLGTPTRTLEDVSRQRKLPRWSSILPQPSFSGSSPNRGRRGKS